jgi:predicted Zn finger-like uncharacterized protein
VFIDQTCPSCRATFQVPDDLAGKRIRCKTCGEAFRVAGAGREDDYDDEARPRRRRSRASSPLVPLLIVVGIVAGCLLVAGIVVVAVEWSIDDKEPPQPVAVGGQPRPNVRRVGLGPNKQNAPPRGVAADRTIYTIRPIRLAGRLGRPAEPPEGPIEVTLSNQRREANTAAGRPGIQVDYQTQGVPADGTDQYYLVVKGTAAGEAHVVKLATSAQGTLSCAFAVGFDPGQTFDIWVEREPIGKSTERKRVSKPVTLD